MTSLIGKTLIPAGLSDVGAPAGACGSHTSCVPSTAPTSLHGGVSSMFSSRFL